MLVRDKTANQIERLAVDAFKDHQVAAHVPMKWERDEGNFGWWKVQKPGTWVMGFYVANMPGMVHQHGDIGGITVSRTPDTAFGWFRGVTDLRYFQEKIISGRRSKNDLWSADIARENLACLIEDHETHWDDPYIVDISDAIDEDLGPHPLHEVLKGDDYEYFCDCDDWDTNVLWSYWALRKFIDLTVGWPD